MTKKEFLLTILIPFFILCLCVKGEVGNFDTKEKLIEERSLYGRFEFSGHAFESSRTRSIFLTTLSLVKNNTFDIPLDIQSFSGFDIGFSNNKAYAWTPPGTAFIGAIFYLIFNLFNLGQVGAYLSIVVISTIIHFLIYKIVKTFISRNQNVALLSSYLYSFATFAFVYSITYFQHQYTILFLCILLYGVLKAARDKCISNNWSYIVPFIYGISIFFDYPNIIILLPLLITWLILPFEFPKNNARLVYTRTPIIIVFCFSLLLLFNQINFNNPLQMINTLPRENQLDSVNINKIIKEKNNLINIFNFENTTKGLNTLLLKPSRGIFFFSPILILGILYIPKLLKIRPRLTILLLLTMVTNILLYSSFSSSSGGWCFGPRYLLPTALILSIITAVWINSSDFKKKYLMLILLLLSILNSLSGTLSTLTIPERMDTVHYGIKNFNYILNNVSGSFIYNTYFYYMPLLIYYGTIAFLLIIMFYYIIFRNTQDKLSTLRR